MKKNVISLAIGIIFCATLSGSAQGLYFKLGGSYAVPLGSQSLLETSIINVSVNNNQQQIATGTTESIKGSYGAGIYTGFSVGYKFSPFIGIDLNVSYLLGNKFSGTSSITGGSGFKAESSTKSKGIFVSPTAMFMIGGGTVRPYALMGVIGGSVAIDDDITGILDVTDTKTSILVREESKGDYAFGFRGGAGIDINVASKFSVYAEVIFNSISYYAKEKEITQYEVDGVDVLPDLSVRNRRTVYVDKVTVMSIDGNEVIDDNAPTEELRKPLPLSNLSFGMGVKYRLNVD